MALTKIVLYRSVLTAVVAEHRCCVQSIYAEEEKVRRLIAEHRRASMLCEVKFVDDRCDNGP
jgi:hypothetical protein